MSIELYNNNLKNIKRDPKQSTKNVFQTEYASPEPNSKTAGSKSRRNRYWPILKLPSLFSLGVDRGKQREKATYRNVYETPRNRTIMIETQQKNIAAVALRRRPTNKNYAKLNSPNQGRILNENCKNPTTIHPTSSKHTPKLTNLQPSNIHMAHFVINSNRFAMGSVVNFLCKVCPKLSKIPGGQIAIVPKGWKDHSSIIWSQPIETFPKLPSPTEFVSPLRLRLQSAVYLIRFDSKAVKLLNPSFYYFFVYVSPKYDICGMSQRIFFYDCLVESSLKSCKEGASASNSPSDWLEARILNKLFMEKSPNKKQAKKIEESKKGDVHENENAEHTFKDPTSGSLPANKSDFDKLKKVKLNTKNDECQTFQNKPIIKDMNIKLKDKTLSLPKHHVVTADCNLKMTKTQCSLEEGQERNVILPFNKRKADWKTKKMVKVLTHRKRSRIAGHLSRDSCEEKNIQHLRRRSIVGATYQRTWTKSGKKLVIKKLKNVGKCKHVKNNGEKLAIAARLREDTRAWKDTKREETITEEGHQENCCRALILFRPSFVMANSSIICNDNASQITQSAGSPGKDIKSSIKDNLFTGFTKDLNVLKIHNNEIHLESEDRKRSLTPNCKNRQTNRKLSCRLVKSYSANFYGKDKAGRIGSQKHASKKEVKFREPVMTQLSGTEALNATPEENTINNLLKMRELIHENEHFMRLFLKLESKFDTTLERLTNLEQKMETMEKSLLPANVQNFSNYCFDPESIKRLLDGNMLNNKNGESEKDHEILTYLVDFLQNLNPIHYTPIKHVFDLVNFVFNFVSWPFATPAQTTRKACACNNQVRRAHSTLTTTSPNVKPNISGRDVNGFKVVDRFFNILLEQ